MTIKKIKYKDLELEYLDFGEGKETVICFHGHGKSAEDFLFLEKKRVRVISINLFLHGNSTFSKDRISKRLIQKKDVEKLLENILVKEDIQHFHLVAYSQGGRFVLTILPSFYDRILSVHLLAVDGLNDKNFYSWSQRRWWARLLFRRWTKKPSELIGIAQFLAKRKIIHSKIVDFLKYYAEDKSKLRLAYKTWSAFRALRPNYKLLKETFSNKEKRFKLILGKNDQIITVKSGKQFLRKIAREDALVIIDCGHDFFREEALLLVEKEIKFKAP